MNIGIIALLVLALLVLTPLSRLLIAALFGRSIGEKALARQPDTITLAPTDPSRLRHAERLRAVVAEFQSAGFEDGGLHSIPEMPGVSVQLMAHRGDSMAAAIYDHPVAGLFFDTVSRYVDGSTCTYTTAPATGLKHRENTRVVSLPGAEPAALIQRAKRDRPQHGLKGCSPSTVGAEFTTSYAEYVAWIKRRGVSRAEVIEVAKRKVA
jgi:hypothetical protein